MADFPAAHSMDTCWFAVDRDGHVACFNSGEAGAVPLQAVTGEDDGPTLLGTAASAIEMLRGLLRGGRPPQSPPPTEMLFDLRGRLLPGATGDDARHQGLLSAPSSTLMFLKSAELIQKQLADGSAVLVPVTEGVGVLFRELSAELAKSIHDAGACLGCFWYFASQEEHRPGFFYYGHLAENWISGPYGRETCPVQPLHIDDLPADLRERVRRMRFDNLRFVDTPHIQPVEHAPCESWESAFMDVTGKRVAPIPGKEAEYAAAYEDLKDLEQDIQDIVIEPPAGDS